MASEGDSSPAPDPPGLMSIYIAGFFSMGMLDLFALLIPLYAISLKMSATEVGMLVGARGILSMVFAIHAGATMDRFGTRRVTLVLIAAATLLAPLYPLMPNFWALLALQLVSGCAVSLNYTGTQTLIAQIGHGDAEYIGRYSFASRMGTTAAPILIGMVWDFGGAGLSFPFIALWGMVLFACVAMTPNPPIVHAENAPPPSRFRIRDMLPRWSDYSRSFAMLAIPAVAISIAVIFPRNATSGIQNSLYVVYVEELGFTGTAIGILFAAIELTSGIGSLFGGRAMRQWEPQRLMVVSTAIAIALVCVTPWLGGIFLALIAAQAVRGLLQGVMQPVMFSVQAKSVGRHEQGRVVGLRQTINRMAAISIPPLMGWLADTWGLAESFLILGAGLLVICAVIYIYAARAPRFGE